MPRTNESVRQYWANMTAEQRSKEMKRRQKISRKRLLARMADNSSESPFPPEVMKTSIKSVSLSQGSIKQRLEAIESALAVLKSEIGF